MMSMNPLALVLHDHYFQHYCRLTGRSPLFSDLEEVIAAAPSIDPSVHELEASGKIVLPLEGINGCLKTTFACSLSISVETAVDAVKISYRPHKNDGIGDSEAKNILRSLTSERHNFLSIAGGPVCETILLLAYESAVWADLLQRSKDLPPFLLVDRMHDSSVAIQSAVLESEGLASLETAIPLLTRAYHSIGYPRKTLFLDFPYEDCKEHILERQRLADARDMFTDKDFSFLFKVYRAFTQIVADDSDRFIRISEPAFAAGWSGRPARQYDMDYLTDRLVQRLRCEYAIDFRKAV